MHNKFLKPIAAIFISILLATPTQGRFLEVWTYQQLVEASDLVVLVEPLENQAAKDTFPDMPTRYSVKDFEATDTLFKVHTVVKGGSNPTKELTVLHFNYSKQATNTTNGGLFIVFPIERGTLQGIDWSSYRASGTPWLPTQATRKQGRIYLAFLKLGKDGRFEPVRGQYDSRLAFRELREDGPNGD